MIFRIGVGICALAVIAAATDANVRHTGGYASDGAWLAIAMAALLTVGMGFVGVLWQERRRFMAFVVGLCFLAGEAYWLGTNADRELGAREALSQPTARALEAKIAGKARLDDAKVAKKAADDAAVSEAAKPGCRENCAKLLGDAQKAAATELAAAREAYDALPNPRPTASLAAHLNIPDWLWDLLMAGLRSVATMGASIALGAALHGRKQSQGAHENAPAPAPGELEIAAPTSKTQSRKRKLPALPPPRDRDLEHVSQFLKQAVFRPDPEGQASLKQLRSSYIGWCQSSKLPLLPPAEFGKQLRSIIDAIGLECEAKHGDMIIHGATIH
jgi:hypothetical protein